ncbi:MAG: SUMF1/EgtB/PvdO family nonheme iron enzyme [Chloroflexi bacterium]|nr:SUMF1/EgtB/PvdO family nonheme iron enzyme [Chloroflexota bacterium]
MAKQTKIETITAQRDVVMGDQINQIIQMPAFQPHPDLKALRREYLTHLERSYHALDFKGIPQLQSLSRELRLEEVYVPLVARPEMPAGETWERRLAGRMLDAEALPDETLVVKTESAPLAVEQAMGEHSRVVVLGDPGSGKTTLLKHLTLHLAAEKNAPLPILVPMNAYAAALEQEDINLQGYLPHYFAGLAQGIANLQPLFDAALEQGQAVVLLDGLDEVQNERARLVHKVETFAAEAVGKGNKVAITSRIVGYREAPLNSQRWSLYTLLDFDHRAIEDFAQRWCLAFEISTLGNTPEAHARAEEERRALLDSITASPGVGQLASNPLLLTILALIKRQGVSLPNRRVELYELYLKTLITAWSQARALDKRPAGPALDYLETVSILGPLALWLRQENPTAGLVSQEKLLDWLTDYHQGEEWGMKRGEARRAASAFLKSVRKYSNLLLERGQGRYGFIHLTFEEALAARGLEKLSQTDMAASLALIQQHLTDPGWRETILLAIGVWGIVRENPHTAGKVVEAMLAMECSEDGAGQNIIMAGTCLEDVGAQGLGRVTATRVQATLLAAIYDRSLPPAVQCDAGFILGRTGWHPDDLDTFIPIPAGPFLYGDEKEKTVIEQPFEIAKYPVTNLQYRRFVDAGGYNIQEFWSAEGWAWRTGDYDSKAPDKYKNWLSNRPPEKRNEPYWWHDRKWNNPLTPVVGVSWFEAEAYCNWLARELGKPIRLPTEQEWERAARGVDGREYPWGNEFDRNKANCAEFWANKADLSDYEEWKKWLDSDDFNLASTSLIGQFSNGDIPESVRDLGGNVWEWTNSWWEEKYINRVLRGGAWDYIRRDVRCAYRNWFVPDNFLNYLGFRVLSPRAAPL